LFSAGTHPFFKYTDIGNYINYNSKYTTLTTTKLGKQRSTHTHKHIHMETCKKWNVAHTHT